MLLILTLMAMPTLHSTTHLETLYVKVYYNPNRPQEAVLERGSDRAVVWTLFEAGSLFLVFGLSIGSVILLSSLDTCGIVFNSTQPRPGAPVWCYR